MLSREAIRGHLAQMTQYLAELAACRAVSLDRYLTDNMLRHGIERRMELIVEAAIDVNASLLVMGGRKPPRTYRASFADLGAAQILDLEFARKLRAFADLRNSLAHQYESMTDEEIHLEIGPVLDEFRRYLCEVTGYLDRVDHDRGQ